MQKYFFIRANGKYVKINFADITYIEGCRNYIKIVTENKIYLALIAMKRMAQLLPGGLFKRVHKSFIVSLEKITWFDSEKVCIKDKELPIGHQYKTELEKSVIIVNNDTVTEPLKLNSFYAVPMITNGNLKREYFEAG